MKIYNIVNIILFVLIFLSTSSYGDDTILMSEEKKQASLDNLINYQSKRESLSVKSSYDNSSLLEEKCFNRSSPQSEYCHNEKYTDGDFLIVNIYFSRDLQFPVQPRTKFVPNAGIHNRDTTERDDHLLEWSGAVIEHYLGNESLKFSKTELIAISKEYVVLSIYVLDPSELNDVLKNKNIAVIRHVADPLQILEEST